MELKYTWRNLADDTVQIDIFSEIDSYWGYSLASLTNQLNEAKGRPLSVRLNSPGGSVVEGLAIANLLNGYSGGVTVQVVGYAASIASVIVAKANKAVMSKDSFLMIHEPYVGVMGATAEELANLSDTAQKFEDLIVNSYLDSMDKRGKKESGTEKKIRKAMKAETWYTAQEALELGLIDEIVDSVPTYENIAQPNPYAGGFWNSLKDYKNIPEQLKNKFDNINQEENKMTKTTFFEKIKNLINGVEDETEPTTEVKAEVAAFEMTVETAQAFLAENGFTVTPNEEVFTAEDMAVEFENAVNLRVESKLKAIEADKKKGAFTAAQAKKDDTKTQASPFDSVSGFLKGRK